jgi:hypothetical protein
MHWIRTPKQFIETLVEKVMWDRILKSHRDNAPYPLNGKIGKYTLNLDEKSATLLKELKSDDLQNVRWPKC